MGYQPAVSIIIAVKNAKALLAETLQNLRQQNYSPLEVIVVDGASTDGTQELVKEYSDIVKICISEPDRGISDAFNKGIRQATGEYINFQGAGDTLYHDNCLAELFAGLDPSYQLICGKILRVKEDGKTPVWIAPKRTNFTPRSLLIKMTLPHQGLFMHRSYFEKYGEFDLSLPFAMDYELLLRSYRQFPKTCVKDMIVARWREGGVGQHRIPEVLAEYHKIKLKHRIASPVLLTCIDRFNRFKYYLKSTLKMAY